jgi:tetratricopeptide (TPR) repeat protein
MALFLIPGATHQLFANGTHELVMEGNRAYDAQEYQQAAKRFEEARAAAPNTPEPTFNLATTLYKMENYQAALTAFQQLKTDDSSLHARSHYNQGNVLARAGRHAAENGAPEALEFFERSISAYRRALELDSSLDRARHNIEVVKIWLDRMRQRSGSGNRQQGGDGSRNPRSGDQQSPQGDSDQGDSRQGDSNQPQQNQQTEERSSPDDNSELDQQGQQEESAEDILEEEQRRRDEQGSSSDSTGGSATW